MKVPMIILFVAVFLLFIVAFLARDYESEQGAGSKAYHMILLGLMQLDVAFWQGVRYVHIALTQIFKGYRLNTMDDAVDLRQRRVQEYRRMNCGSDYRRKHYNRKILD